MGIKNMKHLKHIQHIQHSGKNRGITMVELVIGMAVLSIVGLIAGSLLSSSIRMYRGTIITADLQTESQMVSRRLSDMIMNAKNIYYDESDDGIFLFTGAKVEGTDSTAYTGEVIWFNKEKGSLYQHDKVEILAENDSSFKSIKPEEHPLTATLVKAALEGGTDVREYLISDKISQVTLSVSPELKPEEQIKDVEHYYVVSGNSITINYDIVLQYLDSKEYRLTSGATPRNRVETLRWRTD